MGTVRPSTGFLTENGKSAAVCGDNRNCVTYGCLLDDYVLNVQVLEFEALGISVSLSVLQQSEDEFDRFLRPTT